MQHTCLGDRFAAVVDTQFAVDAFQMAFDSVDGDEHCLRDLLVGTAVSQQLQYFDFTFAQGVNQ